MNKSFRKFILYVMAVFNIGVSSFTAYCSGSSKKIAEEKKPSKKEYVKIKLGNGETSMLEFKQFTKRSKPSSVKPQCSCRDKAISAVAGDKDDKRLPSVYTFYPEDKKLQSSSLKWLVKNYDVVVFEPGSFGVVRISNVLEEIGINKNEAVWKKEIVPLNDYYANMEESKVFKLGCKLVLTNTKTGNKLIFNVPFGNTFTEKMSLSYDLHTECKTYNQIIDIIMNLEPVSPNGTYPERIKIDLIKGFSVIDRVKSIRKDCFSHAENLTSVDFVGEIESLGNSAFYKCENLKRVNFMKPIKYIENRAFSGCICLQEVKIPEGLKKLGAFVFANCLNLRYLFLPDSLEEVSIGAFVYAPENLRIFYKCREFNKKNFINYFGTCCGHVFTEDMYK